MTHYAVAPIRARVAGLSRTRAADDLDLLEAKRDLKAETLAAHVARIVDSAPPLSAAQRDRIAALLHPRKDG